MSISIAGATDGGQLQQRPINGSRNQEGRLAVKMVRP